MIKQGIRGQGKLPSLLVATIFVSIRLGSLGLVFREKVRCNPMEEKNDAIQ